MHEKLISELEYHRSMIPSYAFAMDLLDNAAAALREDVGTIADLRAKLEKCEGAIDYLSTFPTSDADVHILYLNGENPFYIEVMSESGNVRFKGKGKSLLEAINNLAALKEGK